MPPRIDQIKAVALEAQIELWLATVQRGNCLIRTQDKGTNAVAIVMEGRESGTRNKYGLPASAAGIYLTGKTGRNLLREVVRNLPWEAHGEPGTWLAANKIDSRPAREKFFLDNPLS